MQYLTLLDTIRVDTNTFKTSLTLTSMQRHQFLSICHFFQLPHDSQVLLYPLLATNVQVTIRFVAFLADSQVPLTFKQLSLEFSISILAVKQRLEILQQSGLPIELTRTTVRMKTQAECQSKT